MHKFTFFKSLIISYNLADHVRDYDLQVDLQAVAYICSLKYSDKLYFFTNKSDFLKKTLIKEQT